MNRICEARASEKCTGRAVHTHHRKLRSQGGTDDQSNLLAVCLQCHHHIHMNPALSYERGWLVKSWDTP